MESGLQSYINKYGFHFTDRLAGFAISTLTFSDGVEPIPPADIKVEVSFLEGTYKNKHSYTIGDIIYSANEAKASMCFDDDAACIEYALALTDAPNGYNGMAFARWCADIACKGISDIDWIS